MKEKILSHDDFNKFLFWLPRLQVFQSRKKLPVMSANGFIILFKLLFYCALRPNEAFKLKKSNFDFEKNTINIQSLFENRIKETTIPPIILGDVKKFVTRLDLEDYLFQTKRGKPIERMTAGTYARDIGNLAGLKIFQITENREIEGISLSVFRESYKQLMYEYNASQNLVDLKLRNNSKNRYGNYTIHDLKKFENKIFKRNFSEDEISEYVTWYTEQQEIYEKLSKKVEEILKGILEKRKIIFHDIKPRVKDVKSFREKIKRGILFDPKRMQDLSGIRIICYVKSDVDKVCKAVEDTFGVISKKEHDEEYGELIGYSSIQYTCNLPKSRIRVSEELTQFENKVFEIQVRTILQHAWSEIEHDDIYKNVNNISTSLKRRFYLVSKILESADNELDNLHFKIKEST